MDSNTLAAYEARATAAEQQLILLQKQVASLLQDKGGYTSCSDPNASVHKDSAPLLAAIDSQGISLDHHLQLILRKEIIFV